MGNKKEDVKKLIRNIGYYEVESESLKLKSTILHEKYNINS